MTSPSRYRKSKPRSSGSASNRRCWEPVGVVGLGLMGRGIAACLVSCGLRVLAYDRSRARARGSRRALATVLQELAHRRLVAPSKVARLKTRYAVAASLNELSACPFVIESVNEAIELKRAVYDDLERVLAPTAIVASNTSSFPITLLQQGRRRPARFIGMHWGEPVAVMRYLEITRGRQTSNRTTRLTQELGVFCDKEPTVLNRDIRGFISNRLMYAMIREAFYLLERGVADVSMIDRSFRNDIGWWATLAGPFRWMDLTGISAYAAVAEGLFPELSSSPSLPKLMKQLRAQGAEGTSTKRGFYAYPGRAARDWQKAWIDFTYDIRSLVEKYEKRVTF